MRASLARCAAQALERTPVPSRSAVLICGYCSGLQSTFAAGLLLTTAYGCPDDWYNPCIISDPSEPLGPVHAHGCAFSGDGYLGTAHGNSKELGKYVNTGGRHIPGFDWGPYRGNANYLNLPSYNAGGYGSRSSSYMSSHAHLYAETTGTGYGDLYTTNTYLQECSNICVNHPECTTFGSRTAAASTWTTTLAVTVAAVLPL